MLIDCGWPGTIGRLRGQMRRKAIDLRQVKYLLVTHFHPDHAGLTQELRNEGMELLLMDVQLPFAGDLHRHIKEGSGYVDIILDGSFVLKPEESRRFLGNMDIRGEVVPTPGHSPDSVSLVLDEGCAFTGDLTHQALLTEADVASMESWRRIPDMGAKRVFPAHGNAYSVGQERPGSGS